MEKEKPESTYQQIEEIIGWYHTNSSNSHVSDLLDNRDKLAILSFRLSKIVGDVKGDYNSAYFMRVINVAREKQAQIEQKLAYNKAEVLALLKNEKHYKDAIEKESISFKNDMLLKGVNKVLEAMNQRISFANTENRNSNYTRT